MHFARLPSRVAVMPYTQATAQEAASKGHESRRVNPFRMAIEMQVCLHKAVVDPETPVREAAQAACAWDKLEARKAILRGLPANTSQSIRADTPKKTRRQSQQASAPIESEQDEPPRTRASAPVHPTEQLSDNVTDARGAN